MMYHHLTLPIVTSRFLFIYFLFSLASCNFLAETDLSRLADSDNKVSVLCDISCVGVTVGSFCGGGIYVGEVAGDALIAAPGNCISPTNCDGTTDTLQLSWSDPSINITGATNPNDGRVNVASIFSDAALSSSEAATFCDELQYGGCADWYLPAEVELIELSNAQGAIGGFAAGIYWASNQTDATNARSRNFDTADTINNDKSNDHYVRCVRRK